MKKILAMAVCGLALGCTPENLLTSSIPATPPAKPESKPERILAPVTPAQVSSDNARQKLLELEAELESDARMAKP